MEDHLLEGAIREHHHINYTKSHLDLTASQNQLQKYNIREIIFFRFQALNGFLMILDCNGELFFATHTIETYLGFHQSDVIHQSVYELVHSEDREELQRQLGWNSFMGSGSSGSGENSNLSLQELLSPEHNHLLDRSFTVRFRCLLDNTSGFLVRPNSTSLLKNLLHKKHERLEGDEKAKSKGEISVGSRVSLFMLQRATYHCQQLLHM